MEKLFSSCSAKGLLACCVWLLILTLTFPSNLFSHFINISYLGSPFDFVAGVCVCMWRLSLALGDASCLVQCLDKVVREGVRQGAVL